MRKFTHILGSLIFILAFFQSTQAQSLFYDAKELVSLADSTGQLDSRNQRVLEILDKYHLPGIQNSRAELIDAYDTRTPAREEPNPFIELAGTSQSSTDSYTGQKFNLGEGISKIGSLNVTTIADGAAQFLLERAKQELVIAYFEKFNETLNQPEFKTLFPTTNDYLNVFQTQQLSSMLDVLKDAFTEDLDNLPENVIKLETIPRYKNLFATNDGKLVKTGLLLTEQIKKGDNLADILHFLSNENDTPLSQLDSSYTAIYSSIRIGNILSESLRSIDNRKVWVDRSQIIDFLRDDKNFNMYLGLLLQQTSTITLHVGGRTIDLKTTISSLHSDVQKTQSFRNQIIEFSKILEQVNHVWEDVDNMLNEPNVVDFQLLQKHSLSLINLIEHSGKLTDALFDTTDLNSQLEHFAEKLKRTIALAEHLREKEYTASLMDISVLLKTLSFDTQKLNELVKYGIFISSIAEADSAQQVQEILEANVLPPTSYRTKRTSKSSIDINAYVGVFGGLDVETENYEQSAGFGPWMPIGPAFTLWTTKEGAANTLFFSFIDLGAIASFRVESTDDPLPEFELQNIISPGIFYVRGIKKSPLSWHLGLQYGPNVRTIEQGVEAASYRIHAGISVDIPLFNLRVIPKN